MWRCLHLIVWGVWWGGLCFYAVFVVPIGTDVIGSVAQGFVTQRVTQWHNAPSAAFLVLILFEAFRRKSRVLWCFGAFLASINIALFFWHARLTDMMDFHEQTVPGGFYSQHAVYLWITAAEWLLGMAVLFWIAPMNEHVLVDLASERPARS